MNKEAHEILKEMQKHQPAAIAHEPETHHFKNALFVWPFSSLPSQHSSFRFVP